MRSPRTYLAFDYGTVRTGVAVGQTLTGTATPLRVLAMDDGKADEGELDALINTWQPDGLIIGLPATPRETNQSSDQVRMHPDLRSQGGGVNIAKRVCAFAAYLRRRYRITCYFVDERLTTRVALGDRRAMSMHPNNFQDEAVVDSRVAAMLLCEWMTQDNDARVGEKQHPQELI